MLWEFELWLTLSDFSDKPRSAVAAEYLAHGYSISDTAIERAIAADKRQSPFLPFLPPRASH